MPNKRQILPVWLDHPFIVFFLPYYRRLERVDIPPYIIRDRFMVLQHKAVLDDVPGILSKHRMRYEIKFHDDVMRVQGPYGYRAWTMQTVVAVLWEGNSSVLDVRIYPHWRITLFLLLAVIFISVVSVALGFPFAPFFPLVFFVPFFYVALVVATKIEAATIEAIVRRLARNEPVNISY